MIIQGEWGWRDAPFVEAVLICPSLNLKKPILFLIDTGASRTTILDTDAEALGLNYSRLEKLPTGTVGIGGVVDTYVLPNVRLLFESDEGPHEEQLERAFALKHTFKGKKVRLCAEQIKAFPSLLGRDIINRFRLIADRQANLVIFTDER